MRLKVSGTSNRLFQLVHTSKLKRVKAYMVRPTNQLNVVEADRLDIDEAMLPEDSWERTLDEDTFRFKMIMDVHSGRNTCFGRLHREYLV